MACNKTVAVVAVVVAAGNKTVAVAVAVVLVDKMAIVGLCFAERCNSKQGYNLDNTVMNMSRGSFLNERKTFFHAVTGSKELTKLMLTIFFV